MTEQTTPPDAQLQQLAGAAVQRALAARQGCTELTLEEASQVGGAALQVAPLSNPTIGSTVLPPPIWVGIYLPRQQIPQLRV